jgi:hypothetical protein
LQAGRGLPPVLANTTAVLGLGLMPLADATALGIGAGEEAAKVAALRQRDDERSRVARRGASANAPSPGASTVGNSGRGRRAAGQDLIVVAAAP